MTGQTRWSAPELALQRSSLAKTDSVFSQCGDGRCVKTRRVCDGHPDCNGGEDEEGCPDRPQEMASLNISGCGEREWRCRDRHYCVHQAWLCDGDRDCPDGSDE